MTPREIDARLAERLFGWIGVHQMERTEEIPYSLTLGTPPNLQVEQSVPFYSTSWEGMGLVVEKMMEREDAEDFVLRFLGSYGPGEPERRWYAKFGTGSQGSADHHDAPMAVALAALKAIGEGS